MKLNIGAIISVDFTEEEKSCIDKTIDILKNLANECREYSFDSELAETKMYDCLDAASAIETATRKNN